MNVADLLLEAGVLMIVGMMVVFVFLTMLIFATKALTRFALAYPEPDVAPPVTLAPTLTATDEPSKQVIAAIGAAITQYRNKNK